jgi:spermidine synthase
VCFVLSGSAALIYEVVWTKQLAYLLGNSLHATATVVAAFLGGLALGARFLGTPLARRGRGPRVYAVLELVVAGFGLAWLPLLRSLDPAVGALYRSLGGESGAFALARFALLFVLLVPPAAAMGATLPVLVAHFDRVRVGPGLALLYAINTLGAVLGSLAGGFVLLPSIGLGGATWVAAAINVAVAALAWRAQGPAAVAAGGAAPARPARAPEPAVGPGALPAGRHLPFALLFGASGFAALVFQIAWVRLFSIVFGSSVYSFSAVLGVYLLGLAAGSLAVVPLVRAGAALRHFGHLQIALALAAAVALHTFRWLPEWVLHLGRAAGPQWGLLLAGEVALCGALLFVPCMLLGAVFPVATQLLQRHDTGHAIGVAYGINTIGTIAGTLAGGFLLVPRWGVQGTHVAGLLLALAIGLVALALDAMPGRPPARRWAAPLAVAAVVAALTLLAPGWDASLMAAGTYRPIQAELLRLRAGQRGGEGAVVRRAVQGLRVLLYREGINGSVVVEENPEDGSRALRVGGKVDASTGDMETQVLLGLVPAACADSGARTLVVGLGSGATLAAALAAGAGGTEVVELEPAVVEASRFFHGTDPDPLDDPRVRLLLGDARTHLAHGSGRYGLIISEPSNPWVAGENNLFTVDFYRMARARLEPGGVFCQWIQCYELSPGTFGSLARSFLEVFPDGHVFTVWGGGDVLFVALPPGRVLDAARLATPAARRMLARGRLAGPDDILGRYAVPFATLRESVRGAVLNRDDRPVVEYRAPRDLIRIGQPSASSAAIGAGMVPFHAVPPAGGLFAAWPEEEWIEARAASLAGLHEWDRAAATVAAAREAGHGALAERLAGDLAALRRRAAAEDEIARATQLEAEARNAEAIASFERAARADSTHAVAWVRLAVARRRAGDVDGARQALGRAGTPADPALRAEAEMMAGVLAVDRGDLREAALRFREVSVWDSSRAAAYVLEARARMGLGDRAGALAAARRGLERCPGDPGLVEFVAALDDSASRRPRLARPGLPRPAR